MTVPPEDTFKYPFCTGCALQSSTVAVIWMLLMLPKVETISGMVTSEEKGPICPNIYFSQSTST
ncbi:MAG: hypothetical protein IPP89_10690 [Saprospiraceae bacterium]|nr:hypothetical protein [Candidatus Brachybacter algidus]MBL0119423.1 hypothetical protein [Candidatus Brachybacter algidus]